MGAREGETAESPAGREVSDSPLTSVRPRARALPPWKRLVFALIPLALVLLAGEVAFRAAGYQALMLEPYQPVNSGAYFWISDQRIGFRNRANGAHRLTTIVGAPLATTDKYGYRNGYGWDPDGGTPVVGIFGDSIVFCAEVPDDQTSSSALAKLLEPHYDVRVLNAGVRGHNTVQALYMIEEAFARFPQLKVVIHQFSANDYIHNIDPYMYNVKAPTVRWDRSQQALVECPIDELQVPAGQGFFAPNQVLAPTRRSQLAAIVLRRSVLLYQVDQRYKRITGTLYRPVDYNASRYPKAAGPDADLPPDTLDFSIQKPWADAHDGSLVMIELLRRMKAVCEAHGAKLLFVSKAVAPERKGAWRESWCQSAEVDFVNIAPSFTDDPDSYKAQLASGGYDGHYNDKGARAFAEAVYPAVEAALVTVGVGTRQP